MVNKILFLGFVLLVGTSLHAADTSPIRDPLRPLGYQGTASPTVTQRAAKTVEWRLAAVLISPERTVAVINGQSLQIGDQLNGYELVEIESDKVLLQKNQKKLVLRRAGTGFKKALSSEGVVKGSRP